MFVYPIPLEIFPSIGLNEFPADELRRNLGVGIGSLSRCVPVLACERILSAIASFHALNILEQGDEEYAGELATFTDIPCVFQISGCNFWRDSAVLLDQWEEELTQVHWEREIIVHCARVQHP